MTSSRHPSAAFWITLVAVLVAYPLSFGPACWLVSYGKISNRAAIAVHRPILNMYHNGPQPIRDVILWYSDLVRPPELFDAPAGMGLFWDAGVHCLCVYPP